MVHYLVYVSYSSKPMFEEDLRHILEVSSRDNAKANITGMLLYLQGRFIQILEGSKNDIEKLYDKIIQDPRHKNPQIILEGRVVKRNFSNWNMGFKRLDLNEFTELSGFQDPDEFFTKNDINNSSHPALIFMRLFYQKNNTDYKEIVC